MDKLEQHIESIIFSSEQPIALKEIKNCLEQSMETKIEKQLLEKAMEKLVKKFESDDFAFEVVEISGGYQFLTKGAYHHTIGTLLKQKARRRLSKAALETLAIIAYRQPVTKSIAESIRGVSCDYSIQKLLEKELISIVGRSEGPGRPLLYATSEKFMDYFGLKSIQDLPKLKEFAQEENTIGEAAGLEESVIIEDTPENGKGGEEAILSSENKETVTENTQPVRPPIDEAEEVANPKEELGGETPDTVENEEDGKK